MAGFNVPTRMTPERLAQIAAAGFRPPQPMNMPRLSMPQAGGGGDGGLGAGIASLGAGLGMLGSLGGETIVNAGPQGSGPGGEYTTADAMAMAGLSDGRTLGPRRAGGGLPDFLTGQPQAKDKWSMLGNLLLGAGVGISQADASGRGWASGIAPGLMMGTQLTTSARRHAEEMALRRAQYAMMLDRLRTQGAR